MKESILDVLLYLFEHYIANDADLVRDRDSLQNGLLEAGFSPAEIHKACDWLDGLAERRHDPSSEVASPCSSIWSTTSPKNRGGIER